MFSFFQCWTSFSLLNPVSVFVCFLYYLLVRCFNLCTFFCFGVMRPLQAVWFLFYFAIIMTCLIPATSLTLFIVESWKCSDLENVISVEGTVVRLFYFFLGFSWSITAVLSLSVVCFPFRKGFVIVGVFWIVMSIPSFLFISFSVGFDNYPHSYKNLSPEKRLSLEHHHNCCFYVDEEDEYDNIQGDYKEHYIYGDCSVIDQTDPFIDWSGCYLKHDKLVCPGSKLNYAQSDFCSSGSDYATYISFEVVMGLYGISCLVFTVICFAMYYLTEDHKVEGVTERLKEDNRLLDHQY